MVKHFLLKFNHGVEIGAYLAYVGHFKRTGELGIHKIIQDELDHRYKLRTVLQHHGETPNQIINFCFTVIGFSIQFLCKFMPIWSLDFVARIMELFAIVNYNNLKNMYPQYYPMWAEMANCEERHGHYFKRTNQTTYVNSQTVQRPLRIVK